LSTNHQAPSTALRLGMAVWRLWYLRGYWTEGRQWLRRLLGLPGTTLRQRALLQRRAGQLAWLQGDYREARELLEECLAFFRRLGTPEDLPAALNALGEVVRTQGDYAMARSLFEESLALLRAEGDEQNIAWALQALGEV